MPDSTSGVAAVAPERLYGVFGRDAFEAGLFYANEPALRFELSRGSTFVEQFTSAYDRAREIARYAFRDSASLVVVLAWFGDGPPVRHLSVFRSLRACGVRMRRPRSCWTRAFEEGGEVEQRTLVAFRADASALDGLLWGALAVDLGIRPRLLARVYLADPERGLLLHPYDDRGMAAIGPDRERLRELFARFHDCLLAYDLARMEAFFAPGGAGTTP
ncbi:MAG TPA: DUF3885 domain-containing protein [Longimicrobiaceae bacterium]|nr:DUF3885 domain-containing protein [Longimicrobiaceae bacterium]